MYTPGREASGETSPADTLILDFQPPELREINFCGLNPSSLWSFVMMGGLSRWI